MYWFINKAHNEFIERKRETKKMHLSYYVVLCYQYYFYVIDIRRLHPFKWNDYF